jgi:hypothetical protein
MTEEKMFPAEVMEKAACEHNGVSWEKFKELLPETAARNIERQRAALRALAAMSLPPAVLYAARGVYDGDNHDEGVAVVTRAVLLAAADEGETPS